MRQNLTLFFFFYSLYGFAQFYVHQGVVLYLETPNSTLSIQEREIQINSPIDGQGTLVFNSFGLQTLESTQEVLEIPNLFLQNADWIRIHTPLRVAQHFTLQSGELHLEQPLYLPNPQALELLGNSSFQNIEFLVYDLQIERSQPFLDWNHFPTLTYTIPTFKEFENRYHFLNKRSIFGDLFSSNTIAHIQLITPPPEATYTPFYY